MKKIVFVIILLLAPIVTYILKTEGKGKHIPTFVRPTSVKVYKSVSKYTPKSKTLNLEIDGQDVLRSQSEILRRLMYIPKGEYKKITIKHPSRISTGVKCGDNQGLQKFNEQCMNNYQLIEEQIQRITGRS